MSDAQLIASDLRGHKAKAKWILRYAHDLVYLSVTFALDEPHREEILQTATKISRMSAALVEEMLNGEVADNGDRPWSSSPSGEVGLQLVRAAISALASWPDDSVRGMIADLVRHRPDLPEHTREKRLAWVFAGLAKLGVVECENMGVLEEGDDTCPHEDTRGRRQA